MQPGAPGEATRPYEASGSLSDVEGAAHTEADVDFMEGMIHHHAQALEMTALIDERTDSEAIEQMGLRMEISQADEIRFMERWLAGRDGGDHTHSMMPGMLTPEQMASLRSARGTEFDRLFLELMIQHHRGALIMVEELFTSPGAGQESTVFHFASEVEADQGMEIRRMLQVLETLR